MHCQITVLPQNQIIRAQAGKNLLQVLRDAGLVPEAPCGGMGRCGKCKVSIAGEEVLACQTVICQDMTVTLPTPGREAHLSQGITPENRSQPNLEGFLLALDIGTTTVVGYLLDGKTGRELCCESMHNPQASFGADVICRIRHALNGQQEALTQAIRDCVQAITLTLCQRAGVAPEQIRTVSLVGNPAMQQFFLGICPENLARIPFSPVLTHPRRENAGTYLPLWKNAQLLTAADISGFVGADTVACILSTGLAEAEPLTLLVDIGTNGELVLGNRHRMVTCATAAGPALEGACIQFGMRGQAGAIDHVWLENGSFRCSVIGSEEAKGICGSGLIDAVAAGLEAGLIDSRGRILNEKRLLPLTDTVYLTQDDIRQVQLAKGAIAAGIELMAAVLGISLSQIGQVWLAGAFGTHMNAASACRIGLLPAELSGKIRVVGNAAGSGAKILACDPQALEQAQRLTDKAEFIELAALPGFQRCFARNMRFINGKMDRQSP